MKKNVCVARKLSVSVGYPGSTTYRRRVVTKQGPYNRYSTLRVPDSVGRDGEKKTDWDKKEEGGKFQECRRPFPSLSLFSNEKVRIILPNEMVKLTRRVSQSSSFLQLIIPKLN